MSQRAFWAIASTTVLAIAGVNALLQISGGRHLSVQEIIEQMTDRSTPRQTLAQTGNGTNLSASPPPPPSFAQAGTGTNLSALEQAILDETNAARTNPQAYAAKLEKLTQHFDGNLLKIPGEIPLRTQEGVSAVNEAIQYLKSASPQSTMTASGGMSKAAADHVKDQGPGGNLGHTGTDGSQPWDRLNRYGEWQQVVGENISYGPSTGEEVVVGLIVDDGVPDRGHRDNIFKPEFRVTGVACGDHAQYETMCVITYAGGYDEN